MLGKPANIHIEKVLITSHKGRRISEDAFNEVLHILQEVLVDHKMEEADINAVADLVLSYKDDIVHLQQAK